MQKNLIIAVIITAVIAGGAGYTFGQKAGASNASAAQAQGAAAGGRGNFAGRGGRGGGAVGGQIIAKDASSITVQLRGTQTDGSAGSKIVFLSDSTQVMKSTLGSTSDLVIGAQVTAIGTPNADGSVNAQSVQLRPNMPDFGRPSTTPAGN